MTFEIGQLNFQTPLAGPRRRASRPSAGAAEARCRPRRGAYASDIVPASPPPEVLAEVDAAWDARAQLAAQGRELHFSTDEAHRPRDHRGPHHGRRGAAHHPAVAGARHHVSGGEL